MFCSRNDHPLALNFPLSDKLLRKLNFSKWKFLFVKTYSFSFFFNRGHFWLHVDRWCFADVFYCSGAKPWIIFILFYQSVLCDTSYVLCSIMHSSYLSFSHNPNFPSLVVNHSGPWWLLTFPAQKMLEVPLCTYLHIFLSINEITSGIHTTGLSQKGFLWPQLYFSSSLYIDHPPPSEVIFHDIH